MSKTFGVEISTPDYKKYPLTFGLKIVKELVNGIKYL